MSLFLAVLGLHCCMQAVSSCGQWERLSSCAQLLTEVAPLVTQHTFRCSMACGIFPDQGSNLYPLHWQADSHPLSHQGSPMLLVFTACLSQVNYSSQSERTKANPNPTTRGAEIGILFTPWDIEALNILSLQFWNSLHLILRGRLRDSQIRTS